MRIQRFISLNTDYSRRTAEKLILEGKIKLNGKPVKEMGVKISPDKDKIEINNKVIKPKSSFKYLILNKPAGYTTTKKDLHAKKTIMDLVPFKDLKPVGRLDKNSEGLIILTDDGDFAYQLTHPKFEHEKEYVVHVKNKLNKEQKLKLENGINLDGKITAKAKVKGGSKVNELFEYNITIHEGRNRQIRRMFDNLGNPVVYLQRIRIGNIKLNNLKPGQFKEINPC